MCAKIKEGGGGEGEEKKEEGNKSLYIDILCFIREIPILWAPGPAGFFKIFFFLSLSRFKYIILSNIY
jgi:hypothetical protein